MIRKASFVFAGIVIGAIVTIGLTQPRPNNGGANAASADTYRELNLFGDIFERVRADYVEVPDEGDMIEAAINGMLSSILAVQILALSEPKLKEKLIEFKRNRCQIR